MNQEQNDWVSFLKELMEFVLNPSNHLIGIDPKLEGNTGLHLLFELAYMLHRICTFVIHGERGLMETSGELCLFYSPSKGGLRNLA